MLEDDPNDLAVDADGDLDIVDGDAYFATGLAGVKQAAEYAVKLIKGEVFFDLDAGIPYVERDGVLASEAILGQKFNEPRARAAFVAALLDVTAVVAVPVLTFSFNSTDRILTVSFVVRTEFGDTDLSTLDIEV